MPQIFILYTTYSYVSHSQARWVQLGSHNSPSHGDRTLQHGTDTVGRRKHRRIPEGRLGVHIHMQANISQFTLMFKARLIATFILLQFPRSYTHSRLSHLAPLQPGSHSQRPVTWWQLELWTQSQLCSQPSPKNPLEQASDKTHKLPCSVYNIRVWEKHLTLKSPLFILIRLIAQLVLTQQVLWSQE